MPISREELERGRIDLTFPIKRVLASRSDLGFSASEIQLLLIEIEGRQAELGEVELALESLTLQGQVQVRELEGQRWYTIAHRRLGFRTERINASD